MSAIAWRRAFFGFGKALLFVVLLAGAGYGLWLGREYVAGQSGPVDLTGPAVPIASVSFKSDGVLDSSWINEWLALSEEDTLMDLDLRALRTKLENQPQVASARLRRLFPDLLRVELRERKPVFRLGIRPKGGRPELWLVSGEGVVYRGQNYSYASLAILPWLELDSALLEPDGNEGYKAITVVQRVSPLLEIVRRDYPELYRDWRRVSFLRPAADSSDPGAYVQAQAGKVKRIRFAPRDYADQMRRLKYLLLDPGFRDAPSIESIDLSHGRSVFARIRPT